MQFHADTPPWGDGDVNFLSPLLQLEILDLARTYVGSTHLQALGKLTKLRQLDVSHTDLEGTTLQAVTPALTGLERLDVSYAPVVRFCTHLCTPTLTLPPPTAPPCIGAPSRRLFPIVSAVALLLVC